MRWRMALVMRQTHIEIFGEGYALYGIEVGDKFKTVENAMK